MSSCARASTRSARWTSPKKTCSTAPGAWTPISRLSCQAILSQQDVTIELPKYTINHARENH